MGSFLFVVFTSFAQDSTFSALDDFEEFTSDPVVTTVSPASSVINKKPLQAETLWPVSILLFTISSGVCVRFCSCAITHIEEREKSIDTVSVFIFVLLVFGMLIRR